MLPGINASMVVHFIEEARTTTNQTVWLWQWLRYGGHNKGILTQHYWERGASGSRAKLRLHFLGEPIAPWENSV